MNLKPGMRLRSQVCDGEVIVVRAPADEVELTCGGHPMIGIKEEPTAGLAATQGLDGGSPLGKRFVRTAGDVEVLVTKAASGTLGVGEVPLLLKDAEPLPSSD